MTPPNRRLLSALCSVVLVVLMSTAVTEAGLSAQEPVPTVVWLMTTHSGNAVARYDESGAFVDYFVQPGAGGLHEPRGVAVGPDRNLYVVDAYKDLSNVLQFDGQTGAFIATFATGNGLDHPYSMPFAPAGSPAAGTVLVTNQDNSEVSRFDAATGAADGIFVQAGSGGLDAPGSASTALTATTTSPAATPTPSSATTAQREPSWTPLSHREAVTSPPPSSSAGALTATSTPAARTTTRSCAMTAQPASSKTRSLTATIAPAAV